MPNPRHSRLLAQLRASQSKKYSDFQLPTQPSFGEMNLFDQALDLLMRPGHTVTSALSAGLKGENVLGGAWKGLSGQERVGYGDILREQGVPEGPGRTIAGLAGDIALDPLSYIGTGPVKAAGSVTVKGITKAVTKEGLAKAGEIAGRLETGLKRAIPAMPEAKLIETAARASRQAPEARALLRGLSPAELRGEAAVKAMSKGLAAPHIGNALAKTPGLVAENAIKFAGIPLIKTATIGKAAKGVLEAAKKIPLLGRGVKLAETAAVKGGAAARKLFSSSTGNAELDAIIGAKRDLKNVGQAEAGEFAGQRIKDIAKIGKPGTPAYKGAQEEVIRTIEGVPKKEVVEGVLTESRAPHIPTDPRIAAVAGKLQERTAGILKAEGPTINLAPQERSFYLPHYLKPEIEQAIKVNPSSILRDNAPSVSNVMRRTNRKGVLEMSLDDMIHGGVVDADKLDKALKAQGKPGLTAADRLVFEADPVKAVLKREVSSVRARAAAEMRDEIIHSDSFLKSKVDLRSPEGVTEAAGQVATHPDHSLYVTTKDWIEHFMDDAGREALRQGKNRELLKSMMVKIDSPEQIAKLAGKTGRVDGFVLPDEIVQHLNAAHVRDFMDEKVADFVRNVYDPALGWWKAFTTVVRPGFNVRNAISNIWQMFLAGAKNPADLGTAGMLQRAAATGKWGKLAPIAGYGDQEIYKLAREMGVVKSGQLGQGVERFVEDATLPSRNPLSRRGPLVRAGSAVAGTVEDNAKLALFIDGLKKGMDPKSAAMRVKKYLFDYSDISAFEQKYLKRILPFYVWSRKNLPLALETLLKQPGKVALLPKAMQAADKDVDGLDRPVVADWINKSLGIPIKKNEDGTVSYVLMGGLIPTADLARMDTKQLVSMLSPVIRAPLEQLMNEDWFRGKPIAGFPGEMVQFMGVPMPARMAHLVRNLVIVAQVDRGFFQGDRDFLQGMSNLLTGIRTYKQDPVHQLKSYFLHQQKESGMLENEADRQAGKTSLFGDTVVKDQLLARAEQLRGRGETARRQALEISPTAFDVKRNPRPQLAPNSMQQFKARIKGQVAKMYGGKRMAR